MTEMSHDAADHHIYMATYNRRQAHNYRRLYLAMGYEIPGQFYFHMREAIRWIQVGKMLRADYQAIQEKYNGEAA